MKERIDSSKGPRPAGPYSPAVRAGGFVFVSGQIPVNAQTGDIVRGPIEEQVRQTLENVTSVLEAGRSSLDRVVKCTVYLRNLASDFQAMNEAYASFFSGDVPPARTTIQAADLPRSVDVEIDVIALA